MNLYVDDVRPCPEGWALARTYEDAMRLLRNYEYDVVSLDHDLADEHYAGSYGEFDRTGYDIMCAIERGEVKQPREVVCHSWNPVGRQNIERAIAAWKARRSSGSKSLSVGGLGVEPGKPAKGET